MALKRHVPRQERLSSQRGRCDCSFHRTHRQRQRPTGHSAPSSSYFWRVTSFVKRTPREEDCQLTSTRFSLACSTAATRLQLHLSHFSQRKTRLALHSRHKRADPISCSPTLPKVVRNSNFTEAMAILSHLPTSTEIRKTKVGLEAVQGRFRSYFPP